MDKCGEKCEVYSRVTGYFRPVSNWNKGKKQEFEDRKTFKVVSVLAALAALCLTGCKTSQTLSGSGTVAIQRVGVDPETKTPVLKSTVITGDYASARNGDYAFQYRRRKSPSIFNADAITEEVTINYIGTREQALAALELARKDAEAAAATSEKTPEAK